MGSLATLGTTEDFQDVPPEVWARLIDLGTAEAPPRFDNLYQRGDLQRAMPKLRSIGIGETLKNALLPQMDEQGNPRPKGVGDFINAALLAVPGARMPSLAQAQKMGFRTNMPLYHGAAPKVPFAEFDPAMQGASTRAMSAREGIWTTTDPEMAASHAKNASARTGGAPQTYPLLHRAAKPADLHLSGRESEAMVAETLRDAWARGYDAVRINYPKGGPPPSVVVKDPSQLRSPFAAFDPANKHSRNLLAGAAGALPLASMSIPADLSGDR